MVSEHGDSWQANLPCFASIEDCQGLLKLFNCSINLGHIIVFQDFPEVLIMQESIRSSLQSLCNARQANADPHGVLIGQLREVQRPFVAFGRLLPDILQRNALELRRALWVESLSFAKRERDRQMLRVAGDVVVVVACMHLPMKASWGFEQFEVAS